MYPVVNGFAKLDLKDVKGKAKTGETALHAAPGESTIAHLLLHISSSVSGVYHGISTLHSCLVMHGVAVDASQRLTGVFLAQDTG